MPELTDQPNTVNTNDLDPDRFYELVDGDPVAFVTRVLIAKAQGTAPTNEEEIAVAQCCTLLTLQQLVRAGLDFDEALNQFCDGESTRPYKATASIDHGEFEVTITFLDTDDDERLVTIIDGDGDEGLDDEDSLSPSEGLAAMFTGIIKLLLMPYPEGSLWDANHPGLDDLAKQVTS